MKVAVTLVGMVLEESTGLWFCFFKEVSVGFRNWEDVVLLHLASSVPEDSGLANVEMPPLIVGEMPLEFILIAHSPLQYQLLLLRASAKPSLVGGLNYRVHQRARNRLPADGIASTHKHVGVFAATGILDSTMKRVSTTEIAVDAFGRASVKQLVVSKDRQPSGREPGGGQFLSKCNVFAEAKHLLRVLAVARVFQLDGVLEFTPIC